VKRLARKRGVRSLRLYVFKPNRRAVRVYELVGMERKPYCFYQLSL
jgi:RimJ/RimL family protein N-acetyltransferase